MGKALKATDPCLEGDHGAACSEALRGARLGRRSAPGFALNTRTCENRGNLLRCGKDEDLCCQVLLASGSVELSEAELKATAAALGRGYVLSQAPF